jgi:hypothetical protein
MAARTLRRQTITEFDIDTGEIAMAHYRRSAELGELYAAVAKARAEFASAERAGANEPAFQIALRNA